MRFAAVMNFHFGRAVPYRGVDRKLTVHAPAVTAAFVDDMNHRVRPENSLRGRVAPEHLVWLDQDLAAANRPTIVFTHFSAADLNLTGQFLFEDAPDQAMLTNRAAARGILQSHEAEATHVEVTVNGRDPARFRMPRRGL